MNFINYKQHKIYRVKGFWRCKGCTWFTSCKQCMLEHQEVHI